VKCAAVVAVLLSTTLLAASQNAIAQGVSSLGAMPKGTPTITAPATSAAPQRTKATRAAPRPLSVVIPQQFAPPQEEYASFPDTPAAAAADAKPSACQAALAKVAEFKPLPVLVGAGECGATDAVLMASIILPDQNRVAVSPPATLRCPMAQALADWVRDDVAPSLKKFGPPLHVLDNFDSYSCRGRNNIRAAQLSEHGKADAIDIRDFALADGREFGLTDIYADKDWRDAIRTSACARFSTVLGPGSDGYHEQHIHLDLAERRNNYKVCQWDVRSPPPPEAKAQGQEQKQAQNAAAEDSAGLQGDDSPTIPIGEVPLPRPRPVAQIDRALGRRRRSSIDQPLGLTAQ
jgi:hypothetical protein